MTKSVLQWVEETQHLQRPESTTRRNREASRAKKPVGNAKEEAPPPKKIVPEERKTKNLGTIKLIHRQRSEEHDLRLRSDNRASSSTNHQSDGLNKPETSASSTNPSFEIQNIKSEVVINDITHVGQNSMDWNDGVGNGVGSGVDNGVDSSLHDALNWRPCSPVDESNSEALMTHAIKSEVVTPDHHSDDEISTPTTGINETEEPRRLRKKTYVNYKVQASRAKKPVGNAKEEAPPPKKIVPKERKTKNLGTIKLIANVLKVSEVFEKGQFRMILHESEDSARILAPTLGTHRKLLVPDGLDALFEKDVVCIIVKLDSSISSIGAEYAAHARLQRVEMSNHVVSVSEKDQLEINTAYRIKEQKIFQLKMRSQKWGNLDLSDSFTRNFIIEMDADESKLH
ncbi:unnamed protein product [Caenorhabditis nigoni]